MQPPPPSRIVEVCRVEPLQGSSPISLPLTFFDLFWLRIFSVECLYFYHFPHSFFDSVLPALKHSLSLTLTHFLPVSGNIIWPHDSSKPIINYVPGDSVSFTVAESSADFNYLCSDLCEASQRHHLVPHLTTSREKASLISLQVTLFPNSGICIGITTHHAAMDGMSAVSFMKSWAYAFSHSEKEGSSSMSASLLSLPDDLTPSFDRSVIKEPPGITETILDSLLKKNGPNNRSVKVWEMEPLSTKHSNAVKGVFELTPSNIQKLKQYAESKIENNKVRISTFVVTCAYVLVCAVKAEQPKGDTINLILSVDWRFRLDPPIVSNYSGNCLAGQGVEANIESLLGKDGFISALEKMIEGLSRVKDGVESAARNRIARMQKFSQGRTYSFSGSPRLGSYSIDFGWGTPKNVDIASIDKSGSFSLSESRNNNGGIELGLVMSKDNMEAFSAIFSQELESF